MAGLDKIISQIKAESDAAAEAVKAEAQKNADSMIAKAKKEAEDEAEKIRANGEISVKNAVSRAHSQADLHKRQAILAEKQKLISTMFDKADSYIKKMPEDAYFKLLSDMVKRYAVEGKTGELLLSKKDHSRIPSGFPQEVKLAADSKNGKLTISDKFANIDGGFILSYGGVEENCSFDALINDARDSLQDDIQKLLFA
ncbi:MAG: V-type ATP synthase subunit E [Lachnospiraceae bacterium]|nr:V-type ATP synthase subunit E [Lachnospiraceae bacterium]